MCSRRGGRADRTGRSAAIGVLSDVLVLLIGLIRRSRAAGLCGAGMRLGAEGVLPGRATGGEQREVTQPCARHRAPACGLRTTCSRG
jgi:hypothetical protein